MDMLSMHGPHPPGALQKLTPTPTHASQSLLELHLVLLMWQLALQARTMLEVIYWSWRSSCTGLLRLWKELGQEPGQSLWALGAHGYSLLCRPPPRPQCPHLEGRHSQVSYLPGTPHRHPNRAVLPECLPPAGKPLKFPSVSRR